jgi:hypothetical protein
MQSREICLYEQVIRKVAAIAGSALFLVIAPGFVAGLAPWWISHWRLQSAFLGLRFLRFAGGILIALGTAGILDSFCRFAVQGAGHAGTGLSDPPFGRHRALSLCAESDVRGGGERRCWPAFGLWECDAAGVRRGCLGAISSFRGGL